MPALRSALVCRVFYFTLVLISLLTFPQIASATVNYADFSNNPNSVTFVGDGSFQGGSARLIDGLFGGGRAAMWSNTEQPVRGGFVCMFSFRISDPQVYSELPPEIPRQGGADGFAFVIHTWGTGAIGNGGGQIGYATDLDGDPLGIPYSLAIEFDTYKNDQLHDPDGNHISVHNAGQYYNSADENDGSSLARINSSSLGINLKDGNIHNVRIEYDGAVMKIFVDDFVTPKLNFSVDLNTILWEGSENATVGFTAGAAAESEDHDILNWSFVPNDATTCPLGSRLTSVTDEAGVASLVCAPATEAPDADATGPNTVATPEYHPGANLTTHYNTTAGIDTAVLPDRPTETWAKYYFPNNLSGGPYPVAVLLHGNHGTCGQVLTGNVFRTDNNSQYTTTGDCPAGYTVAPSHRGYDYLAEKLTSWGYIVVSVNANRGITGSAAAPYTVQTKFPEYLSDRQLIWARGRLVLRHLQKLSEWNQGTTQFITKTTLGTEKNDFTGWRGMKITTGATAVKVRALGRMYKFGNSQTHTVRIVRASDKVVVATASVPMTNWNDGQFKYVNLASPVTLAANTIYYVVSQETSGGDKWSDAADTTLVPATGVATIDGKVSSADAVTYDITGGTANKAFGPVDFIYEPIDSAFIKTKTNGTVRNNLTGWVGMKITTGVTNVNVRSLGRIFITGNAQTHTVKIVKASDKSTVGSVSIPMTGGTSGQFKYVNLASPITLAPNTAYYIVSQETNAGDQWYDANTSVTTNGVAVLNGSVSNNGTTTWTEGTTANRTFGPVDFTYDTGTTPAELGVNLKGKIDFNNVGLMGHSRGGEGVRAAMKLYNDTNSPWKDTASRIRSAMTIKGIFEFAPTDKYINDNPYTGTAEVNAAGAAWAVVLPACDGDISDLSGVKPFDRMLKITSEASPFPKATYMVYKANHNYYNTQWQTNDSPGCLGLDNTEQFTDVGGTVAAYGSPNQRKTGLASFLAFFRGNVGSAASPNFNQNFDPRNQIPTSVAILTKIERGYTSSPKTGNTAILNDLNFSESGDICATASLVCSSNSSTTIQVGSKKIQLRELVAGGTTYQLYNHDNNQTAASITWFSAAPDRYFQTNLASGTSLNATSYQVLEFRTSRRRSDDKTQLLLANPQNVTDTTKYSIQLVMADGKVSQPVKLSDYLSLQGPVGTKTIELHPILRTVRIPLADFADADLTQLKSVRFVFNDTVKGAIFLTNVRVSK